VAAERHGRAGLDWQREGADWPNRDTSRFVEAGGLRWHVQAFEGPSPDAPVALLLHGTGASTHSWRDLAPRLATRFRVLAPDLPGHGFTTTPPARGQTLPGMARALSALLAATAPSPALLVGHSAGAAVAARMTLDGPVAPRALVGLNGAYLPLGGLAGRLFSPAAKLAAAPPFVPTLLSRIAASPATLDRLLSGTGSAIDAAGRSGYARLVRSPAHVAGALGMMANWDLKPLERDLPLLSVPLLMIVGAHDRTVPPREAERVRRRVPTARLDVLPGLGHLAHEERPGPVADRIVTFAAALGLVEGP
jgi:magnesium chelatase accessory protein